MTDCIFVATTLISFIVCNMQLTLYDTFAFLVCELCYHRTQNSQICLVYKQLTSTPTNLQKSI